MEFIYTEKPDRGIEELADTIATPLKAGKKILWLVPGGSNIAIAVRVLKTIRGWPGVTLKNLTVTLTDERFGPVGHADSNWQQLTEAGFDFAGIGAIPVLRDLNLEETVSTWAQNLTSAFAANDLVIGQFGIGTDGHIAGILPHSPATAANEPVAAYNAGTFMRITTTPRLLGRIFSAYVFVIDAAKEEAVRKLRYEELSVAEEPCQLLKKLPRAVLYGNQVATGQ